MGIQIGTQLGSYEITSLLGKGGMGEVYRARDTKLKREVAIKILPEELSRDHDPVSRFQREAEVLASLNHPHIAAIYGLEESGGRNLLVMELAEGETLAAQIARGPLPLDETLKIATQIAEALEAAHEKGVMHRDLKPANIKVSANGNVKVLDFGLAKAFAGNMAEANSSNSPTLSIAATNAGVILGTAAYMSPEQARGHSVDLRTDIVSFGAVVYEMLTGTQAFRGEHVSDILAAVLKVEPDWHRLPTDTPAALRRLLRRCLQKDRSRRIQTAIDVRNEIEEAKDEPEPDVSVTVQSRQRVVVGLASALVLLALISAGLAFVHFRETPPVAALEMRTEINTPSTSDPLSFALSPDGRRPVFAASGSGASRLWLRALDETSARPLTGTEDASLPFWSPDSRSVGFFAGGKLKRVDIGGGPPQTLANAVAAQGGTWSADGGILFAPLGNGPVFRVTPSGGEAVAVTKVGPGQGGHRFPQFLPNSGQFLFYAGGAADKQGIYLGSVGSSETKRLIAASAAGMYLLPGWLLYVRQGTLLTHRFDAARAELSGKPESWPTRWPASLHLWQVWLLIVPAAQQTGGS